MTPIAVSPRLRRATLLLVAGITLVALFLRFWRLDSVPPGWRDDELINSLVISQKVLDGELAVYYADASGHEALYHALNAIMLGLFGPGVSGIRWLSAMLGTLSVPLTFLVGRRLFGSLAGLVAAAALAVSFWSLMYSRIGLRHILLPVLALATFLFFLRALGFRRPVGGRAMTIDFLLAALFMSLGFYTYFAGRGVPLILLAFCVYLFLFARHILRRAWRGLMLLFGLSALLAVPLLVTLAQQPESEARVGELAVPLVEARAGNFAPLGQHVVRTLAMFHADGDDEWLYNIPHRPVFGPVGAAFFWTGVLVAFYYAGRPLVLRFQRDRWREQEDAVVTPWTSMAAAFLLIWWLAGISPGFISVPAASLGHTILAQPAVFLLAALPVWALAGQRFRDRLAVPLLLGLLLVMAVAWRDLPAYFNEWPQRGMVRFLYRADIHEVSAYLNAHPEITDFAITGTLAGPWDRLALLQDLDSGRSAKTAPRWYDPRKALFLQPALHFAGSPDLEAAYEPVLERVEGVGGIGGYRLYTLADAAELFPGEEQAPLCFANGLCQVAARYDEGRRSLEVAWTLREPLDLPPMPLISNPPPPGIYAGPRLHVFAHLLDDQGAQLAGDDGLWVDPLTLQPGDLFVQRHHLQATAEARAAAVVYGLYDPLTGARIPTVGGQDHLRLELGE